jgi:4-amino-4-deoxy-L-arabinose transferase-like glycosyltransferase
MLEVIVPLVELGLLGVLVAHLCVRRLPIADQDWMKTVLLAALGVRLAAATAFALIPSLRVFHEDASGYEINGMTIASMWRGDYPPFPMTDTPGVLYLSGAIYYVLGIYRPAFSYFNCIVGTVLVFCVYRLAIRLFHPAVGRLAALLVAFMPSMILWSSMALKDTTVTLALVIALSSCVSLKQRVTPLAVAGILLTLALIHSFRFYMLYFVGFAIVLSLALDRGVRFFTGVYKQIFLVAAALGLFALLGITDRAEQNMDFLTLEAASRYRYGMAITARSGFAADVDVSTPAAALAYLPVGIAHLLWAPFPWQMVSLGPLLAAPETVFWWFLFLPTAQGVVLAIKRRLADTSPLLIFTVTITCAYSLIHGNVGSAFRQRSQILVFLFIFSAAGIYMKRLRRAGVDPDQALARTHDGHVLVTAPPAGALRADGSMSSGPIARA